MPAHRAAAPLLPHSTSQAPPATPAHTRAPTTLCTPLPRPQDVCSSAASFDLPAATLAGAIEELGTAAELAAARGDAPANVFNELGGQGEW